MLNLTQDSPYQWWLSLLDLRSGSALRCRPRLGGVYFLITYPCGVKLLKSFLNLNLVLRRNLLRFTLAMKENQPQQLDQTKVCIHQLLSLLQSFCIENIALAVNPDAGKTFLGCIEDFRDVSQLWFWVQHSICFGVLLSKNSAAGADFQQLIYRTITWIRASILSTYSLNASCPWGESRSNLKLSSLRIKAL